MEKQMEKPVSSMKFEEAMEELESIVARLEANNLSLDKALELFKRGVALSAHLNEKLEAAQGTIRILVQDQQGQLKTVPFALQDEENI